MNVPRVFWYSASGAILIVALSACYFFLVALPAGQRYRNDVSADIAKKEADYKQARDCAEQANRAAEDTGKYLTVLTPEARVSGVTNHYNRKLSKCLADIETVGKNGTTEMVIDAYEQSSILWCSTTFVSKAASTLCMDAQRNRIEPTEATKQMDALMRE
jgi:hypothetical protein